MKSITQIITAATTALFATQAIAEPLVLGSTLPSVEQLDQDGKPIKVTDVGATGYLFVYFYPKADTPGCTKQACSLRDSYAKLTDKGIKTYGVSTDKPEAQKAFKEKYKLPFDLLADSDGKVCDAFGVPKMMGFSKRQAFLFKDAKLVWLDLTASTEKQAEDVLNFLASQP